MADRVLPSREEIVHIRTNTDRHSASILIAQLMTAYAEGRLVDREAIDYEAAIELARTFRNLEWNHRAVRTVVDAAIGDTSA